MSVAASETIVRQTRGGSDPARQRFAILSEMDIAEGRAHFLFRPLGPEMTLPELCNALIGRGVSEREAIRLILDAMAIFERP